MGSMRLPARPALAIGDAYFQILDQDEHDRTTSELRRNARRSGGIEKQTGHVP